MILSLKKKKNQHFLRQNFPSIQFKTVQLGKKAQKQERMDFADSFMMDPVCYLSYTLFSQ